MQREIGFSRYEDFFSDSSGKALGFQSQGGKCLEMGSGVSLLQSWSVVGSYFWLLWFWLYNEQA